MIFAFIGLSLLLIFIIIAVKIGVSKEKTEVEQPLPMIHASGIYSVVRKSPREMVLAKKPQREELVKYLAGKNVDSMGNALSEPDRQLLADGFFRATEEQIRVVEEGDRTGVEFYFYEYAWEDPICAKVISKGQFVTREDIFKLPRIIPPFHIGCGCRLKKHKGNEKLRDTTEFGLRPLLKDESSVPKLPEWHTILKYPQG